MAEQKAENTGTAADTGAAADTGVDKNAVQAWLQQKWTGEASCPVSGDNNWIIADDFVQPMKYSAGGLTIGGRGYPLVMVVCRTCGYTLFINAIIMGLLGDERGGD